VPITAIGSTSALEELGASETLTVTIHGSAAAGDLALLAVSSKAVTDPATTPTAVCHVHTQYNVGDRGYDTLARPTAFPNWQVLTPAVSPFVTDSAYDGNDGNWGNLYWRVLTAADISAGSVSVSFASLVDGDFGDQLFLDCSTASAAPTEVWGCAVMAVWRNACLRAWSAYQYDADYYAYGGSYGTPYAIASPSPDASQGGVAITWLFADNTVTTFPYPAAPGGDWTQIAQEYSATGDLGIAGWYQIQTTAIPNTDTLGSAGGNRWTTASIWLNEFDETPQPPTAAMWPTTLTTPLPEAAPGPAVVDPGERLKVDPIPLPDIGETNPPPNPPYSNPPGGPKREGT